MSQRKRNQTKNRESYTSSDSSRRDSRIKSISHSSEDFHNSRKTKACKHFRPPSANEEFLNYEIRKSLDYVGTNKNYILNNKTAEKSQNKKNHSKHNHSFKEDRHHNLKNKTHDYWKEENKQKQKRNEESEKVDFSKIDHRNFTFNDEVKNSENFYPEGSARTRGFYQSTKKNSDRNKKAIFRKESDNCSFRNGSNYDFERRKQLDRYSNYKHEKEMRRNEKMSSLEENGKKYENYNKSNLESKDSKSENVSMNESISSQDSKQFSKANKSKYSLRSDLKKSKYPEETKIKSENNLEISARKKEEPDETIIFNDSNSRDSNSVKTKTQKGKFKNYPNDSKKICSLMYLIRKLIVSYENNKEENGQNCKNNKQVSEIDSSTKHQGKIRTESSCESSGYDSLKNIQEQSTQIIKNENLEQVFQTKKDFLEFSRNSETISSIEENSWLNFYNLKKDNIEFVNSKKYCLYKIYKSEDGGILLKESQSLQFDKGEYVIGKKILKNPEELLEFSEKDEKNSQYSCKLRNNSTQTELNISKKVARKPSWFRKTHSAKIQRKKVPRKYLASLESTSNSSFPETSDFEQVNLKFRKKREAIFLKKKYSHNFVKCFPKPVEFLKKSAAVDTSDLNCSTLIKNADNKIILLLNSTENEKSFEISRECGFLKSDDTCISGRMKLNEEMETTILEKLSPKRSVERINNSFSSSDKSSVIVPVSWLKLENSDFFPQKTEVKELVQIENSQRNEKENDLEINKKPETKNSETQNRRKKKSKPLFRIFNNKKNKNKAEKLHKLL